MKQELRQTWTPSINVLTWFMLVASILSVFTRIGTKLWIFRKLTIDDILGIVAMGFCIAESIAISIATEHGLGQHMDSLSQVNKDKMMQSQYAADILFIASMCFSKLAIIFFIRYLSPASFDRRYSLGLAIFIVLWTVSGILVSSFECQVPSTWNYINGKCFRLVAWWTYLGVTNILSEVGIVAQASLVVARVQASADKKIVLAGVFGLRMFVVVAVVCQLAYFRETIYSIDPSWDLWTFTISTQMAQALSIITACAPQFKPFLDSLRSSGMSLGGASYGSRQRVDAYGTTYKVRGVRSDDAPSETHELVALPENRAHRAIVSSAPDIDAESQTSRTQIIRETRSWMITESIKDDI